MLCRSLCAQFPVAIRFILAFSFFESIAYYGISLMVSEYVKTRPNDLANQEEIVPDMFYKVKSASYLLGAIIADSCIGKYKTMYYTTNAFTISCIVILFTSAAGGRLMGIVSYVTLMVLALCTGPLEVCCIVIGANHLKLRAKYKNVSHYFSLIYFILNFGFCTQVILVQLAQMAYFCNGEYCFTVSFGVSCVSIAVASGIFYWARSHYITETIRPQGIVIIRALGCIGHGGMKWISSKRAKQQDSAHRSHWLDWADDKYDLQLIDDVKQALRVLWVVVPWPFFWAFYDKQGEMWASQRRPMYGGTRFSEEYNITDGLMGGLNPLMVLFIIPVFKKIVYPLCAKCNLLVNPLQRIRMSFLFTALALICSSILETKIEPLYAKLPVPGVAQLRLFNGLPCNISITSDDILTPTNEGTKVPLNVMLYSRQMYQLHEVRLTGTSTPMLDITSVECTHPGKWELPVNLTENTAHLYIIGKDGAGKGIIHDTGDAFKDTDKAPNQMAKLGFIYIGDKKRKLKLIDTIRGNKKTLVKLRWMDRWQSVEFLPFHHSTYVVRLDAMVLPDVKLERGGVYILAVGDFLEKKIRIIKSSLTVIEPPNSAHILWQLPQIFVLTIGEVMFAISAYEFTYMQAPASLKTTMVSLFYTSLWLGEPTLMAVELVFNELVARKVYQYLIYAGLVVLIMLLFEGFTYGYKNSEISYVRQSTLGESVIKPLATTEEEVPAAANDRSAND